MATSDAIAAALLTDMTIDIVTIGRRSGESRTTEIWFMNLDGRIIICGTPGSTNAQRSHAPRDWMANLIAQPDFTFRFKESIDVDVAAVARAVTDTSDRRLIMSHPATAWYREQGDTLEQLIDHSPIVDVKFRPPFAALTP